MNKNKYETLLVIVPPGAESTPGVHRAAELARASGAVLHLCMIVYDPAVSLAAARAGADIAARVERDLVHEHQSRLQQLAVALAGKAHPVECDVVCAPDTAEAIVRKALQVQAQVVIKDAGHESRLRRALFMPLDWKLMRLLPCELMLVGTGSPSRPSRVAAAIDVWAEPVEAEGLNSRIVQAALRLSEYLGAGLDVVSVVPFVPALNRAWPSSKAVYAEADADHRQSFARFLAAHGIPEDRSHRLAGVPADELVRFAADNQIEVLVLGSIHRGGWDRFLLGSTAEAVAQQIACDLLVVKPADYAEVLSDPRGAGSGSQ